MQPAGTKTEEEAGNSKDEKVKSINMLIKYHEKNGNFTVKSKTSN